ncbi:heterodimeric methylmalonyl-CoA mutase small subunit [Lutibacter oricola]|uniref:Heterodimeric methylmalonyl-CoA mutase small subunit n=1 Tax=Lutibacter oricola TaxID=762486 RepID=A0A1H2YP41_9FLAO|nr:methylmalonyl-CoA mutase family protein [Lutibacter oricola]SDX07002.1 heterodimeric methylmalonyl-CoA mutase small subunit [Lutibacter oricola]
MDKPITNYFEPSSSAAWKQKIQFELDGADYNKTLLTETNEGITIKPFYHLDSFEKINIPKTNTDFKTCKSIIVSTEIKNNKEAVKAINNNIKTLKFTVNKPFNTHLLFKNLLNKNIEFYFEFNILQVDFISNLAEVLKEENFYFTFDIIGNLAERGNWHNSLTVDFKTLENLANSNANFYINVNASVYHNAGANAVQEIAYALAHTNEYLTYYGEKIADKLQFNFSIGSNFFFEISKLRAFRYLFNLILAEYNTKATPIINSEASSIYNNNLESTYSSSIIGGSTIFSSNLEIENKDISEIEELKIVATNSNYIESITKQFAEKALNIFKDIEKSGGFLKQLKEGTIQRKIKENANKEHLTTLTTNKTTGLKTLIIPLTPKSLKNEA